MGGMKRRAFGIHLLTDEQAEIAVKNGLDENVLTKRLCAHPQWTVERAIHTPKGKYSRLEVTWTPEDVEEARANGVYFKLFKARIHELGYTVERAKRTPVKKHIRRNGQGE